MKDVKYKIECPHCGRLVEVRLVPQGRHFESVAKCGMCGKSPFTPKPKPASRK